MDAWIERNFEPATVIIKTVIEKPPESMKPYEAAFKIGVSESYMYKLLNTGEIPFFMEHSGKRIRTDDLAQWLDAREQ